MLLTLMKLLQLVKAQVKKDIEGHYAGIWNNLNIHFVEPDESKDITVQMIEFKPMSKIEILRFYINGNEASLKAMLD